MPQLSVILCAHNPRRDFLDRVLQGLKAQTLPLDKWELLLVDNNSDERLSELVELSWHPNARHLLEPELGLTPARLRGIRGSKGDVIIFVDDDNVVASDYVEKAAFIGNERPWLGAWGAGIIAAEYENQHGEWQPEFAQFLTLLNDVRDYWGNTYDIAHTPVGAGLCVRREVAFAYAEQLRTDSARRALGRYGNRLTLGEDTDMAWVACDFGFGVGRFVNLKIQHLIPFRRTTPAFLLQMAEDGAYSMEWLKHVRGLRTEESRSLLLRLAQWRYERRLTALQRGLSIAARKGRLRAGMEIKLASREGVANSIKSPGAVRNSTSQGGER